MKKPANHTICRLLMMADCHFVGALERQTATLPKTYTNKATLYCFNIQLNKHAYFKNMLFNVFICMANMAQIWRK